MEEIVSRAEESAPARSTGKHSFGNRALPFDKMEMPTYIRTETGMAELDRVLGGGVVDGSVVLIAGEPGIGKSTLLLQICDALSNQNRVLYVSGEESGGQLKYRAKRLKITGKNL